MVGSGRWRRAVRRVVQSGMPREGLKGKPVGKKAAGEEGMTGERCQPVADLLAAGGAIRWRKRPLPVEEWPAVQYPEHKGRAERPPHLTDGAGATAGDPETGLQQVSLPLLSGCALPLARYSMPCPAADRQACPYAQTVPRLD